MHSISHALPGASGEWTQLHRRRTHCAQARPARGQQSRCPAQAGLASLVRNQRATVRWTRPRSLGSRGPGACAGPALGLRSQHDGRLVAPDRVSACLRTLLASCWHPGLPAPRCISAVARQGNSIAGARAIVAAALAGSLALALALAVSAAAAAACTTAQCPPAAACSGPVQQPLHPVSTALCLPPTPWPTRTCASRARAETYAAAPFRPPTTGALHSALHVLRPSAPRPLICPGDASLVWNVAARLPLISPLTPTLMFCAVPALPVAPASARCPLQPR